MSYGKGLVDTDSKTDEGHAESLLHIIGTRELLKYKGVVLELVDTLKRYNELPPVDAFVKKYERLDNVAAFKDAIQNVEYNHKRDFTKRTRFELEVACCDHLERLGFSGDFVAANRNGLGNAAFKDGISVTDTKRLQEFVTKVCVDHIKHSHIPRHTFTDSLALHKREVNPI